MSGLFVAFRRRGWGFPAAGYRNYNDGIAYNIGTNGNYWSSTPNSSTNAYNMNFNSSKLYPANNNNRANGYSVRCVQELFKGVFFKKKKQFRKYCEMNKISSRSSDLLLFTLKEERKREIIHNNSDPQPEDLMLDLLCAYRKARSNKRMTKSQLRFEMNLSTNMQNLYDSLVNRTYKPSRHSCFIVRDPVKREVFASPFRDRVIHHFIFNCIDDVLEKGFIKTSFSCREGKGTLYGRNCLREAIEKCSHQYKLPTYVAKLDISGYFMHIDRAVLWEIIQKKLARRKYPHKDLVNWLVKIVIFTDPLKGVRMRGNKSEWKGLPPSKSFFYSPKGCGLPIGNLTSQLFSNVYLSVFDDFVSKTLKFRYYGRYVDDFYIVDRDREKILDAAGKIRTFLKDELHLTLHPKKFYLQPVEKGVEFLGGVILPHRSLISQRTFKKVKRCFKEASFYSDENMFKTINSYLGYLHHFASLNLMNKTLIKDLMNDREHPVFDNNVVIFSSDFKPKKKYKYNTEKIRYVNLPLPTQAETTATASQETPTG